MLNHKVSKSELSEEEILDFNASRLKGMFDNPARWYSPGVGYGEHLPSPKKAFEKKLTNQYFKNDLDATLTQSLEKMNKKPEEKQ